MNQEKRQQTINDIRVMLDWFEANPEADMPIGMNKFSIWCWSDKDAFLRNARAFGSCEKSILDKMLILTKRFGSVEVVMEVNRDKVCTKRTVIKEVEVDEWDCESLLSEKELADIATA